MKFTITDLRVDAGDSAFLIDDGKTAILFDSGFGFTGKELARKLRARLGARPLNFIFLSHSHYDHVLGSIAVLREYPDARVVSGAYTQYVFTRAGALKKMREMDEKYARRCGLAEYRSATEGLRVDTVVREGDTVAGFRVLELPGHTKCSIGFYHPQQKLLIAAETLGVFDGEDAIVPCFLSGIADTLNSIEKAEQLDVENVLIAHFGLLDEARSAYFLGHMRAAARGAVEFFAERIKQGMPDAELIAEYKRVYRKQYVASAYPEDAVNLNTALMIALVRRELGL